MPFVGPLAADASRWAPVTTVDLRQLPVTRRWKVLFEVLREFGYTDLPADAGSPDAPQWTARGVQYLVRRGMVTDLASVPQFLWGVIASYGRQTLPALLHDMLCFAAQLPGQPAPYRRRVRREADDLFRRTLRASGSGPLRRWLMWSAVRMFGRLPVVIAFAVQVVGAVVTLATRFTWAPAMVATVAGAVGVVLLGALGGVEQDRVPTTLPANPAPVPAAAEYTRPRFEPRAWLSIVLAALISTVVALPVLVLGVATFVTELLVGLGEHSAPAGATPGEGEGTTARIRWEPLAPGDSTVNGNPPAPGE